MDTDERLAELVLYVADRSWDDPDFGATKLNKILFNIDFTHYGLTGESLTGAEYQKLPFGPAPRRMLPVLDTLEHDKAIAREDTQRMGYTQKRVHPLRPANLDDFSGRDIALVDQCIDIMRGMTAKHVSDLSHDFIGWQIMDDGETIPYETIFLSDRPLTEREKKVGRELAEA